MVYSFWPNAGYDDGCNADFQYAILGFVDANWAVRRVGRARYKPKGTVLFDQLLYGRLDIAVVVGAHDHNSFSRGWLDVTKDRDTLNNCARWIDLVHAVAEDAQAEPMLALSRYVGAPRKRLPLRPRGFKRASPYTGRDLALDIKGRPSGDCNVWIYQRAGLDPKSFSKGDQLRKVRFALARFPSLHRRLLYSKLLGQGGLSKALGLSDFSKTLQMPHRHTMPDAFPA